MHPDSSLVRVIFMGQNWVDCKISSTKEVLMIYCVEVYGFNKTGDQYYIRMRKKIISPRKFVKPSFAYLIEKKRDGGEFTQEEIRFIVDSVIDKEMPSHQLAALCSVIYFQGMSAQETAVLSEENIWIKK